MDYLTPFYGGGFADLPATTTPVSAAFLNALEAGLIDARRPTRPRAGVAFVRKLLEGAQRAGIVVLGDSKIEGSGVARVKDRSQDRMCATLRASSGAVGAGWDAGRGYIPAYYATFWGFGPDSPVLSNALKLSEGGLGGRSVSLEKPAGVVDFGSLDFGTMTTFEVAYTKRPDTANVEVLIDGAVAGTINTNAPVLTYGALATVNLPSAGVHSVKFRQTGDYVARIEGIVHRTAPKGVVLYDGARAGAQTTLYVPGTSQPDRIWQSMSTVCQDVAVVVAAFGANDMASLTVGQWETNLRAIVNKARATWPAAAFVFLMGAETLEDAQAGNTDRVLFARAARKVMGEFEHTVWVDEADWFQPLPGSTQLEQDPLGWLADTVHYGEAAGHLLGRGLAGAVLGSGPSSPVV